MSGIADFTEGELWIIRATLEERYRQPVEPTLADIELRLSPHSTELTECPAAYWEHAGCHFIISKTGAKNYRCQFYYRSYEMYGTNIEEYDDISECIVTLLQVQADHEATRQAGG